MYHRHIIVAHDHESIAAVDSVLERGEPEDVRALSRAVWRDPWGAGGRARPDLREQSPAG
jgi:hypothetical protein